MLKRQLAADLVSRPYQGLAATSIKPFRDLCNLFVIANEVALSVTQTGFKSYQILVQQMKFLYPMVQRVRNTFWWQTCQTNQTPFIQTVIIPNVFVGKCKKQNKNLTAKFTKPWHNLPSLGIIYQALAGKPLIKILRWHTVKRGPGRCTWTQTPTEC